MLKDRDISQRTLGFISFSFLTHVGLIAASFLMPNMIKDASSGAKSETYLVEAKVPASLGESAQAEPQQQPVEQTQLPEKAPQKITKKVPTPAKEKAEAATKKVLALPTKKAATQKSAQKVQTVDQNELAANQALKTSRDADENSAEVKPEVAADIEVPQEKQEVADSQTEQKGEQKSEAVESATTSSSDDSTPSAAAVVPVSAAKAVPALQQATKEQPLIAPIQRGAQTSRGESEIGGLSPANNTPAQKPQSQAAPSTGGGGSAANAAGAGGAIRDAESLMEQPGNAKPNYSDDDQRAGRQGTVVFDAMVTREGTVQGIQMRQSSGQSSLDSSAYDAFKKHRYLPGQEGMVRKKFQFVLNGERTVPSKLRRR